MPRRSTTAAKLQALAIFERLGARPALEAQRRILRERGVRGLPRGSASLTFNTPGDADPADLIDVTQPVTELRVETMS